MAEYRQNATTKEWVVIAPGRASRPSDFESSTAERKRLPDHDPDCPFCPGNESKTPDPLLEYMDHGEWSLRVVPNKYAALDPEDGNERRSGGLFLRAGGLGVAEVIIETPSHNTSLGEMSQEQAHRVVVAYRERYNAIAADSRLNLITIFRNHGRRAGTSLNHPHSQIIATPIVPPHVREPVFMARQSYDTYGSCIFCDMVRAEQEKQERIVMETEHFVALCPFASRTPYEVRIYPRRHHCAYGDIMMEETGDFAHILRTVLGRIGRGLNDPDYNFIIRSAPVDDVDVKHYHWYVVVIPKISTPAGFEIGTGIYINTVYPEEAAAFLRKTG